MAAGMPEATLSAVAFGKIFHLFKSDLHNRYKNQLRDTLADLDDEGGVTAVPARYQQLPLIVRINQADQIAQYNAVFMA